MASHKSGSLPTEKWDIKTILLPTDFSESAHNAFEYALHLAERFEAKIVLAHIYQDTLPKYQSMPQEFVKALQSSRLDEAMRHIETYQAEAKTATGKRVEVVPVLEMGRPANEISRIATDMEVDLLIMGTLGAASPSEKILGSVTAEVIDRTECPVLVIPAETSYQPIDQVLYAASLSKQDLQAINQLKSLADPFEANIHSLHIKAHHKPLEIGWEAFEQMYEAEHSANFTFEVVEKENVFRGLQVLMSERKVDLLAMTTFHQQWKDRAVTPSLTREIMLYTDVPLLIFHAG